MYFVMLLAVLLFIFIPSTSQVEVKEKTSLTRNQNTFQQHQIKYAPPNSQHPTRCDLVCPGQPPFALPPNFMQNCSGMPSHSTQSHATPSTSPKPTATSTTQSNEGSEETDGSEEGDEETTETTTKKTMKQKKINKILKLKKKSRTVHHKRKAKTKKRLGKDGEKRLKKGKILLKKSFKEELFRKHEYLKNRSRLDGCYVVCSEENQPGTGDGSNQDQFSSEDYEEGNDDHYIAGEDTPIEIIYVQGSSKRYGRPIDLYQTNNYAFIEPPPFFEYDPFFIEGKQSHQEQKSNSRKN